MKDDKMICIGIESTAHTFGVGIVNSDGDILSDVRDMFKPDAGLGMVPREASDHHVAVAIKVLEDALRSARVYIDDVDIIAFSQGPGLPPCLRVGATVARYLSLSRKKRLIGVNHPVAHIEIGRLVTGSKDPVVVYLSGGNTQIISFAEGLYRIFGETTDVPVGNAFDVVARRLRLKSPGGPEIERLAEEGEYIELPYAVKGMDVSFSGIVTEANRRIDAGENAEDISYSLQEVCFSMLTEVTERALAHTEKEEVLLVGGVAANRRLQKMLSVMCEDRGAKVYVCDMKYAGDNGTMIAWTGMVSHLVGNETPLKDSKIIHKWRTDEALIGWYE